VAKAWRESNIEKWQKMAAIMAHGESWHQQNISISIEKA